VYLTNRLHLIVVCSVIDTQYDVICGKNKKVSTGRLSEWSLFEVEILQISRFMIYTNNEMVLARLSHVLNSHYNVINLSKQ
jgi:hypothetical protein